MRNLAFLFLPFFMAHPMFSGHFADAAQTQYRADRFGSYREAERPFSRYQGDSRNYFRNGDHETDEPDQNSYSYNYNDASSASGEASEVANTESASDDPNPVPMESVTLSDENDQAVELSVPGVPNTAFDTPVENNVPEAIEASSSIPTPLATDDRSAPTVPDNQPIAQASSQDGSVFTTGAVSFRFDDSWASQYDVALPILEAAGFKGTFYITTRQLRDNNFTGFMSKSDVLNLATMGEEVGAHTRTHPELTTLSSAQQRDEIQGSRDDLLSWGINANSFAYPFGAYNSSAMQAVRDAGYASAVGVTESPVNPSSDKYLLESPSIEVSQSVQEIVGMIDRAISSKQWLILSFHRIDTSGDQYSITPENFAKVVDYIKSRGIRVVTVSEGVASYQ